MMRQALQTIGRSGLLLLIIVCINGAFAHAQNPYYDPRPKPPIFRCVTMNPSNGDVTLKWDAPELTNDNPAPTGYMIYKRVLGQYGEINNVLLVELGPTIREYKDYGANAHKHTVTYMMASKGPGEPSPLTDPHSTMFAIVTYDTCADEVKLSWSRYVGWGNRIKEFQIFASERPAISEMQQIATIPGSQMEFKYKVPQNKTFYYYIAAHRSDKEDVTLSNTLSVRTRDLRLAAHMTIDSIVSMPRYNRLTITIDSTSRVSHYQLFRQSSRDEFIGKLDRTLITEFTSAKTPYLIDSVDAAQLQGKKRYYFLAAVDQCGVEVDRSRQINSIIVRVNNYGNSNRIMWDTLDFAADNNTLYRVYRRAKRGNDIEEQEIAAITQGLPLEYKDDVSNFSDKGYSDRFCYLVKAWEIDAQGFRIRSSVSSPYCTATPPEIELPTAICPQERSSTLRLPRNIFAPLSSYWSFYNLYIYNRAGAIVYVGKNEGWNGTLSDGSYAPEGAYVYRLELLSESHTPKVYTGSFMVLYPTRN